MNEFVIHNAIENEVGKKFREKLEPLEIQKVLAHFGLENIQPDLAHRLSYLSIKPEGKRNSHFQDAKEIAELIDNVIPVELSEDEMNKLRLACLLHDVGKSGPAEINNDDIPHEEQLEMIEAFAIMFNVSPKTENYEGRSFQDVPFTEVLEKELGVEEGKRVADLILKAAHLQKKKSIETMVKKSTSMGNLWAAHVYWTYDVLNMHKIDARVVEIASSHHLLEERNPARINLEEVDDSIAGLEVVDKYQAHIVRERPASETDVDSELVLEAAIAGELADKYQAFLVRGYRTHEETIDILKGIIEEKLENYPLAKEIYLKCLRLIEKNKDLFQREMELDK